MESSSRSRTQDTTLKAGPTGVKQINDQIEQMEISEGQNIIKTQSQQQQMQQQQQQHIKTQQQQKQKSYTYNAEKIVGNGSFGVVFKAIVAETGEVVAIKKVFQDKRYKNRELQILKMLHHPNCVEMRQYFYTNGDKTDEVYLNVVMDYIPDTVYKVMKQYFKMKQMVPGLLVKLYSYQMLRSIAYIHAVGICHRDIKPQNVLVDTSTHILKMCDFGSAKQLVVGEPNVAYICSRYYRAPELIFGNTNYTTQIDVWSVGCVVAELMIGSPIFPGESGVDQLVEIIKILGTPTKEQIFAMNPDYKEYKFPNIKPLQWEKIFRKSSKEAIEFVAKLLVYDPTIRPMPIAALLDPYFNELRDPNTRLPNGSPMPDLFNFTQEEFNSAPQIVERLIPHWYKKK